MFDCIEGSALDSSVRRSTSDVADAVNTNRYSRLEALHEYQGVGQRNEGTLCIAHAQMSRRCNLLHQARRPNSTLPDTCLLSKSLKSNISFNAPTSHLINLLFALFSSFIFTKTRHPHRHRHLSSCLYSVLVLDVDTFLRPVGEGSEPRNSDAMRVGFCS